VTDKLLEDIASHALATEALDRASTIPTSGPPSEFPTDPSLSAKPPPPFSVRVLQWCLAEAEAWGEQQVAESRVEQYFAGCTRRVNGQEKPIGSYFRKEMSGRDGKLGTWDDKRFSFCIAARGFAEHQVAQPGDPLSPWRAGVMEAYRDGRESRRFGQRFIAAPDARLGDRPSPGALVIYRNLGDPERGHAETLIVANADGFRSVGANEQNRRWWVDRNVIPWGKVINADGSQRLELVGFFDYTEQA